MGDADEAAEVNVCVAVRCRPMSGKEIAEGSSVIVEFPAEQQIVLTSKKEKHSYAFDHIFRMDSTQVSVYDALGVPLLDKAFEGYNSTIFAYGQTGSGKTHTMMNHRGAPDDRGLIPRISDGLYRRIDAAMAEHEHRRFLVCCSFLEIYNEIIYDLLVPRAKQSKGGLEVKEHKGLGVYVKDLTEMVVDTADKLNALIENGFEHRSTAATKMNEGSSRSHCIFIIKLHQKDAKDDSKNTFSKLNLVDLAGSERAKSTEAEGDRLKEGANINKSLSALGNVINALSSIAGGNKKVFVPYRNSKLTRVLQESLGGNSLCTMVAACSPSGSNVDETLSTLNYAKRAKMIKVSAVKNDEASQVKKLEEEVEALRRKLAQQAAASEQAALGGKEKKELEEKYEAQICELQGFMKQSWEEKQKLSEQHAEEQRRVNEELKRSAERLLQERKNRLQMLERNGDLQLTLQAVHSCTSKQIIGWPDKIGESLKLEQSVRAQVRAVKLFRDSASVDFTSCTGCGVSDAVAVITLLSQVHAKLGSMCTELETLGRLERQLEDSVAQITPEVGRALREAQSAASSGKGGDNADAASEEELVEILSLLQKQLSQHHAKAVGYVQAERRSMGLSNEAQWILRCMTEDGASPSNKRSELKDQLRKLDPDGASPDLESGGAPALAEERPRPLGVSTFEVPDERLVGSSNSDVAKCARLMQTVLYGGWTPVRDSAEEYLEIDLGEEAKVVGVSLQGRMPCSSEWTQTRDLLQLALKDVADKLPTSEKVFKRPPVRLIHDVGVALAKEGAAGCFHGAGGWAVPSELQNYGDLSREQKVAFFETLIEQTTLAFNDAIGAGMPALTITPQDILSGKNCEESNRLLQLLSYLAIFSAADRAENGLGDAAPQWVAAWKLSYCKRDGAWAWFGAGDAGEKLQGAGDATSAAYIRLPSPVMATKVRIHPVEWHRHAGLRCEVHVAAEAGEAQLLGAGGGGASLEEAVPLVCKGIMEVKRGIEERKQAKQREEEERSAQVSALKDKAEQERDVLEQRLKAALAKVEELEAANAASDQRAGQAETELLKMQVERDRISSQVEQLQGDLHANVELKAQADDTLTGLRSECTELRSSVEDLQGQLQVMQEERDLARQKEEELFDMLAMKDEDLMDTNNGYVYLTERLQEKEEEMETLQEQFEALNEAHERLDERSRELSDDVIKVRAESQALKARLAEEERMHKAAQDRYMKLMKDSMTKGSESPPSTSATGRSTERRATTGSTNVSPVAAAATATNGKSYDDDFDEEAT